MRVIQLNIYQVSIPFRFSFKHANAERAEANSIIIAIKTDRGGVGYGEAIPREYLTGETLDSIWTDITEYWCPRLMEMNFNFSDPLQEQLLPLYKDASRLGKTASYGAIDIALFDAAASTRGISIPGLLGFEQTRPRLTAPLGGSSEKSIKKKALLFRALGFKDFKVKTGMDNDIAKVKQARRYIGKKANLRVDSNQGWSLEEAVESITELKKLGVTLFEEPTSSIDEMAILNNTMDVDIMADESLCTYEDAQRHLTLGASSAWNLRLGKNGGFTGVLELIKLAEENNIKMHLGVLVGETAVLSEASLAIAGAAEFIHTEYGFSKILLKNNLFLGGSGGYFGRPSIEQGKRGLGLSFLRKSAKRYAKRETNLNNGVYTQPPYQRRSAITDMSIFRK